MDTLQTEVAQLKWRVNTHDQRLKELHQSTTLLKSQLDAINKSLLQIKWFVVGGLIFWAADRVGLLGLLKLFT